MKVNFSNLPMWQIGFRHHYEEKSAAWESGGIHYAYYNPLSVYRTLMLILMLDLAISDSNLTPSEEPFKTAITLEDRYYAIRYGLMIYQTDNGYVALSGDDRFTKMSPEIRDYCDRLINLDFPIVIKPENIKYINDLDQHGRKLFNHLKKI